MTITALKNVLFSKGSAEKGLMTCKDSSNTFCHIFILLVAEFVLELRVRVLIIMSYHISAENACVHCLSSQK